MVKWIRGFLHYLGSVMLLMSLSYEVCAANSNWRQKQEIWWNDAQLVKNAIVSYLSFQEANPAILTKENPNWEIMSLLLILDRRSDPNTMRTLVSLSSYYLGESGNEVYQCVLLRKGKKLLPELKAALRSSGNDCNEVIGASAKACLPANSYKARLQWIAEAIEKNHICYIEK